MSRAARITVSAPAERYFVTGVRPPLVVHAVGEPAEERRVGRRKKRHRASTTLSISSRTYTYVYDRARFYIRVLPRQVVPLEMYE